jgi:HlyD family secretion protein
MKKFPRPTLKGLKAFALAHKAISVLVVVALISGVYGTVKAKNSVAVTSYILGTVTRGTITTSVSGTGTVSASDQIDVKAKASGEITSVPSKTGDELNPGDLIATIDSQDASIGLKSAELSLAKLTEAPDESTLIEDKQALSDAQTAETQAYASSFNETASTFLDLSSVISGMDSLLYTNSGYLSDEAVTALGTTASSYRTTAGAQYDTAKSEYQTLSTQFKAVTISSSDSTLLSIYTGTEQMLADMLLALKDTNSAVEYVKGINSNSSDPNTVREAQLAAESNETDLSGWTSQVSGHADSLTADINEIQTSPSSIASKQAALDKFTQGADPLDVQTEQLDVEQKQEAYDDTFVTAPFAGEVGRLDVKIGDTVGTGDTIATMISTDRIAEVSLNEVDAAQVKTGDKAVLTFDAVDGLSISGTVSSLDLVGTVTQGVVDYNAEITFDSDDPRVLPGMSVNAEIITQAKTDVLNVPSSAVKSDNQGSYVLVFSPPLTNTGSATTGVTSDVPPVSVPVQTGLTSDTSVEITSGLTEGEQIVTRTTSSSQTTATTQSSSLFGGGAGAGGARPAGGGNTTFGGGGGGGAAAGRALGR